MHCKPLEATVALFGIVAALAFPALATAADLDAPLTMRVTVGSEIQRGRQAAFECMLHGEVTNPSNIIGCVDAEDVENRHGYVDGSAFSLGLYFRAWFLADNAFSFFNESRKKDKLVKILARYW